MALEKFKATPLPVPTPDYSQQYMTQLIRVLGLYFSQLDSLTPNQAQSYRADDFWGGTFHGIFAGSGIEMTLPYGSFYQNGHTTLTANITNVSTTPIAVTSTAEFATAGFIIIGNEIIQYTSKTATTFAGTITRGVKGTTNVSHNSGDAVSEAAGVAAGSSAAAVLDTVITANGVTVTVPDTKIYFDNAGVYNIQFSLQLLNYTNAEDNVTVWFKKNGTDIPNSASIDQVNSKHGSVPGATIMALNYMDTFAANDYVELYWASGSGNTVLATYPPGTSPTHPASPSMILTVSFVSAIP